MLNQKNKTDMSKEEQAAANQFNEVYESIYQAQRDAEELQVPAHLKDQLMSALTDAMHALYRMDTEDPADEEC
jgi:replication-associated recombination protein RarA